MSDTAHFIADYAVPALALLVVATALIALALWRYFERREAGKRQKSSGLVVALLAVLSFLAMTTALNPQSLLGQFDQTLASELRQQLSRPVLQAAFAITQLGNFQTLMLVGLVVSLLLIWRRRWLDLSVWLLATAGNGLLNRGLKHLFERIRPLHEHGLVLEQSYSFPSGHAAGSTAVYGMLIYLLLRHLPPAARLPVLLLSTTTILLIGFSRVLLHVHYFSDVLAGFASATLWLTVCISISEWLRRRNALSPQSPA